MKRKLIYVPVVHNPLAGELSVTDEREEIYGKVLPKIEKRFLGEYNRYWDRIDGYLASLSIDKIYLDGLYSGLDLEGVVSKMKELDNSRNCKSVLSLLQKGAELMHTEDLTLIEKFMKSLDARKRDHYIADKIDKTLKNRETGVLYLGMNHNADKILRELHKIPVIQMDYGLKRLISATAEFMISAFPSQERDIRQAYRLLLIKFK